MDMNQYIDIFIEESKEHLQNMNQILLKLETNTNDLSMLNEIFRIAHTLKGMSGTMGYMKMAHLTHEMENVLQSVRNKEIDINEHIIDILFECFDTLEEYINELTQNGVEGDLDPNPLIEKLKAIMGNSNSLPSDNDYNFEAEAEFKYEAEDEFEYEAEDEAEDEFEYEAEDEVISRDEVSITKGEAFSIELEEITSKAVRKASEKNYNSFKIKIVLNSNCMLKSARAFIVFNTLEKFGDIIKSNPSVEEIEDERFDNFFEVIFITKLDEKTTKNQIESILEIERVAIEKIEPLTKVTKVYTDESTQSVAETRDEDDKKRDISTKSTKSKSKTSKTVRVDIDRLDNLMNLVSELIIIKTRLEDIEESKLNTNMNDAVEYLERITTSLNDAVMKVRMVPIERVFNRFPRMVRDLAKELGKEINLYMTGEETEVDRTVIDEIGDPLIHLLRNSIDHGIEDPFEREKLDKPKVGNVYLRAYPDENNVVIEVEDDGKGICLEKVKDKAISKGLVSKEAVSNMNEEEVVSLLFKPGFSTAEKISDISGRGVGLDAVKIKIESLGGLVEVHSKMNKGSKFVIRLPLTLAIIQALMVTVGEEKYALPLNSIKEIATIKSESIRKVQNQEVVLFRNNTLPILRMNGILQVDQISEDDDELIIVVVKKGDKTAGLVVDNLIGQQEVVIKSLGKYLSGIKVIAGATILGNGQIALIVDPNSLF